MQSRASHNAPYHHFGDRQGLLKAVAARGLRDLLAAMTLARDSATSPRGGLLAAGSAYVDFAIDNPGQFTIIFDPEVCDPAEPNPVTGPLVEANDKFLSAAVSAVLPEADEATVQDATAAQWGLVHGVATLVSAGHLPRQIVSGALASGLTLGEPPKRALLTCGGGVSNTA